MKVLIKSLLRGAKQAEGTVIIIDVFRASSLITTLLANGVDSITPVVKPKEARDMKKEIEDTLILGERFGVKLPGFDYNISPAKLSNKNFQDKNIVLTTTNGTRGIKSAKKADEILVGSFLNAKYLANYLKKKKLVTLVPIGSTYGRIHAPEDELCAKTIKNYIEGKKIDFNRILKELKPRITVKLRKGIQKQDVDFCLTLNKYKIIPCFKDGKIISK